MRQKLGRPKRKKSVLMNMRMTEEERNDLRRLAIANNCTMIDWIRDKMAKEKRKRKADGTWPEETERE